MADIEKGNLLNVAKPGYMYHEFICAEIDRSIGIKQAARDQSAERKRERENRK